MRIHVTACSDLTFPDKGERPKQRYRPKVIDERRYRPLCRGDQFEILVLKVIGTGFVFASSFCFSRTARL